MALGVAGVAGTLALVETLRTAITLSPYALIVMVVIVLSVDSPYHVIVVIQLPGPNMTYMLHALKDTPTRPIATYLPHQKHVVFS